GLSHCLVPRWHRNHQLRLHRPRPRSGLRGVRSQPGHLHHPTDAGGSAGAGRRPERRRVLPRGSWRPGVRRRRRLPRLHPSRRAVPAGRLGGPDGPVRVHQLRLGLPDPAGTDARARVNAVAQPVLAVLPGQDLLRGPADRCPPRARLADDHRPPLAHLRPHPAALRRRLDRRRPDAARGAGRGAGGRHVAVDADPPNRLRARVRRPARPPGRHRGQLPHHLRRVAELERDLPDRRRRGRPGARAGARALGRHRGRRPDLGRGSARRQGAHHDLRQHQGEAAGPRLRSPGAVRLGCTGDHRLVPGGPGATGGRLGDGRHHGRARRALPPGL
ncbi:MAG: putative mRNA-binding protein, partial [uncultured Friedmanniella sp.]